MGRNPDLDKLLREVDSLTSNAQTQDMQETAPDAEQTQPQPQSRARKESSFMNALGGFFISKVEDDEPQQEVEDVPPPSPNTIEDLAASEPAPDFSHAAASADDISAKPFAEIYAEAGISEADFTVDKLADLLNDPTLKDQPMSTKTLVLKMALKAQNVAPETPVTDAVRRDRATDAYQKMLNQRAAETETNNNALIQNINEEVKALLEQKNAEMDTLREETREMRRQAETFAVRRQAEEQRLADLVVPLLEGKPNPVHVGNNVDE